MQIDAEDLQRVQACIEKVEQHKHRRRQHAFAAVAGTAAPAVSCATAATRTSAPLAPSPADAVVGNAALLELAQRVDASLPDAVLASDVEDGFSVAGLLQHAATAARRALGWTMDAAPVPSRTDVFAQWCWRGAGHMHSFALAEHVQGVTDAVAATRDEVAAAHMSPYYRTTVFERDCILAHRIWSVAEGTGARCVVAVVGANHVPGILRNWPHAGSQQARSLASAFLSPPAAPADTAGVRWKAHVVDRAALLMEAAAVGAAAYLPWRALSHVAPRAARWVPLGAVLAGGAATVAAGRQQQRVAQLVDNIAAHHDRLHASLRSPKPPLV